MTTAFFLRHGPTVENMEGRIQGQQSGTLLIPDTERYLSALVPLLREKKLNLLLSSDLDRAIGTRDILKKFLLQPGLKEGLSPLLRERAMGFYEGMLWAEVPEQFREQRRLSTYDFRSFGGENAEDVQQRVRYTLREFAMRYPNQHIGCVTHAGWIKELVRIADSEGVLPDQWSDRTAIYEAGIGPLGKLQYFYPVNIDADIEFDNDEEIKGLAIKA